MAIIRCLPDNEKRISRDSNVNQTAKVRRNNVIIIDIQEAKSIVSATNPVVVIIFIITKSFIVTHKDILIKIITYSSNAIWG